MSNGASPARNGDREVTTWWQEVEAAVRCSRPARARRFLRWIVTCRPDEEEAWLALAHLACDPEERLRWLHQAYTFHPASTRVVSRLAEARTEFLASNVKELVRPPHMIRCLPDERRRPLPANGASHNGHHPHRLNGDGHTPGILSWLLDVIDLW